MAIGKLDAKLTYGLPSSNTVSQAFEVRLDYNRVSSGTIDVAQGSTSQFEIPFVETTAAQGVVVRNLTDRPIELAFNDQAKDYALAPGGMFMHSAPTAAGSDDLDRIFVTATAPTEDGTVEYVVLGA